MKIDPQLVNVAIAEAPALIEWVREAFAKKNPTAPEPTDVQVIAAANAAFQSSLLKDDAWLAAHPASSDGSASS